MRSILHGRTAGTVLRAALFALALAPLPPGLAGGPLRSGTALASPDEQPTLFQYLAGNRQGREAAERGAPFREISTLRHAEEDSGRSYGTDEDSSRGRDDDSGHDADSDRPGHDSGHGSDSGHADHDSGHDSGDGPDHDSGHDSGHDSDHDSGSGDSGHDD